MKVIIFVNLPLQGTYSDKKSSECFGLPLTASLGSVALSALVLSSIVFTIVTVVLMKGKAKLTRELSQARGETRETTAATVTVDYENIELNDQVGQVSAVICTKDNVAYAHIFDTIHLRHNT